MRSLLPLPLLLALVVAYPYSTEYNEKTVVTTEYYPDHLVIYEGKHDIVDIVVPLNRASNPDTSSSESQSTEFTHIKKYLMVFFVEADIKEGHREDQGIYLYRDDKVTKVMDKGRAVAASADDSEYVFFGAKDGLYVYNPVTQKAEKYGNFDLSVKDMAKESNSDVIYVLTDDRELYKVYDSATKKEKIDDVKDAEQIMIDYSNNLYYYGQDKKPYVRNVDGEIKEISGLPDKAKEVKLYRPPIFYDEEVGFLVDNKMYTLYADGTSEADNFEFLPEAKPTAYSMEAGIIRFFGYQKKIYEYNLFQLMDSSESESVSKSHSYSESESDSESKES